MVVGVVQLHTGALKKNPTTKGNDMDTTATAYLDAEEERDQAIGDIDQLARTIFQQHQDGHMGPFGTCQISVCMAAKRMHKKYRFSSV